MAVSITRTKLSARELRAAASKAKDAKAARRMLAIALVLEGVDRQTLRDWVHRYNAEGLKGLSDRRSAGPKPRLTPEQKAELAQMVREGPDPTSDGVVRWRRVDLQRRIEADFGVTMHERTVGKQLAALGFRRLSVRRSAGKRGPIPVFRSPSPSEIRPRSPGGVQKNFAAKVEDALPKSARGKPLETWLQELAMVPPSVRGPWRTRGWASRGR